MKQSSLLSATAFLLLPSAASSALAVGRLAADPVMGALAPRDTPAYSDVVCKPATKDAATGSLPPCIEIENIEILCTPNGTEPLYLQAHAQCMCGGSFFAEWAGCQDCLFVHGLRSDRDMAFYSSVIATVSTELCAAPTPAAAFSALFSSAAEAEAPVTTGDTALSDRFPGQTDVSLYYTVTGSAGPGPITGSAAKATNTGGLMTAPPPVTTATTASGATNSGTGTRTSSRASGATGSTTSQSANAAGPTQHAGRAFVGVAAAAVLAVAL